jgi:hypothetical protein
LLKATCRAAADWYASKHETDAPKSCCIPENPRGSREEASFDPLQPHVKIPRKVINRGSHPCAIAGVIAPPLDMRKRSIRLPAISDFDASSGVSQHLKNPHKNGESNGRKR